MRLGRKARGDKQEQGTVTCMYGKARKVCCLDGTTHVFKKKMTAMVQFIRQNYKRSGEKMKQFIS